MQILIKISDENTPLTKPILGYPRFNASKDKTYLIVGGLGGLGLEFTDWLIIHGARNLVIVSRNGIRTGYQRMKVETWKHYGINVSILSGMDATKLEDCEYILRTAEKQAPVDGIFNLAGLLRDGFIVNQTVESFEEVVKSKATTAKNLDVLSRKICPKLRHFVVFSSIACGRGNNGQSNYAFGNGVMERICERRVEEGFPGMAVQWGMIKDVGLAVKILKNKQVINGTMAQSIPSFLEELEKFLCQSRPIVSSYVIANKQGNVKEVANVLEAVMNIMSKYNSTA